MKLLFLLFIIIAFSPMFSCNVSVDKETESITLPNQSNKMPDLLISGKDTFYSGFKKFPDSGSVYYEDEVLLKGVYKLNSIDYPSVGIVDRGDQKIINYYSDSNSYYSLIYNKMGDYWVTKYFTTGDTAKYYNTYEYVLGDQIVAFTYTNPELLWFHDVMISKKHTNTIYIPRKGFSIPPSLDQLSAILNDYDYKEVKTLVENGKHVEVRSIRTSQDGKELLRFSSCFLAEPKSYSLGWWQMHGSLQKEIKCDSLSK